jgi:hypothetical protein
MVVIKLNNGNQSTSGGLRTGAASYDLRTGMPPISSHNPTHGPSPAVTRAAWACAPRLVGSFGDGRITAVDRATGHVDGQLRDRRGKVIVIDGLWALLRGTANTGGTDAVWFSAGPNEEADGLLAIAGWLTTSRGRGPKASARQGPAGVPAADLPVEAKRCRETGNPAREALGGTAHQPCLT